MNAAQLLRLCQDLELLGSATSAPDSAASPSALGCLTSSTVDVVFARCKALDGSSRRLGFQQWLRALAALSSHSGVDLFAVITAHALQLQPRLSEEQAAHDAHAALPASRQAGARCLHRVKQARCAPPITGISTTSRATVTRVAHIEVHPAACRQNATNRHQRRQHALPPMRDPYRAGCWFWSASFWRSRRRACLWMARWTPHVQGQQRQVHRCQPHSLVV